MPLKLILIRHAKSDWSQDLEDHARHLNPRGRRQAPLIGAWLAGLGHVPDAVLCSDATRTGETWGLIADALPARPPVSFHRALYLAPAITMLNVLRGAEGQTVAMVGHNPGIADFAHGLVVQAPDHPRFSDYPTGAVTVITFPHDDWRETQEATGTPVAFSIPSELED